MSDASATGSAEATPTPANAAQLTPSNFITRWLRLVNACSEGKILPFAGAGISYGATVANTSGFSDLYKEFGCMPKTLELTRRMMGKVAAQKASLEVWQLKELERLEEINLLYEQLELDKKTKGKAPQPGFAEAAQLYLEVFSEKNLYDELGPLNMRLFRSLEPNLAHSAISWLAREGLYTEVITTNYDCALEKAYVATFYETSPACLAEAVKSAREQLKIIAVIHNLHGYRAEANRRQTIFSDGRPAHVLRIFKINGCAEAYQNAHNQPAERPGFLIITDRHLQSFDERQWAHDLFRDRFRCRNVVFTGFGAEEPQVRFTALRVIEEFSRESWQGETPHCFIQEHGPIAKPHQLQIAKFASTRKSADSSGKNRLPAPHEALFTGADYAEFPNTHGGLGPDSFWLKLYLDVAPRLIERRLERCLAYACIREHDSRFPLPCSRRIAAELRDRLYTIPGDPTSGLHPWMLSLLNPDGGRTPRLMRWVAALHWYHESASARSEATIRFYDEWDRYDSDSLLLLYVLHLLGVDTESVRLDVENGGIWFLLSQSETIVSPETDCPQRWIWLRAFPSAETLPAIPPSPKPNLMVSREAVCLLLRSTADINPDERMPTAHGIVWRTVRFVDWVAAATRASLPKHSSTQARFRHALLGNDFEPPSRSYKIY